MDVNKQLSAGKNRVNPLMIAASHGSLDIARILVQNGATIEQTGWYSNPLASYIKNTLNS